MKIEPFVIHRTDGYPEFETAYIGPLPLSAALCANRAARQEHDLASALPAGHAGAAAKGLAELDGFPPACAVKSAIKGPSPSDPFG